MYDKYVYLLLIHLIDKHYILIHNFMFLHTVKYKVNVHLKEKRNENIYKWKKLRKCIKLIQKE
jgi:hypothetical protein